MSTRGGRVRPFVAALAVLTAFASLGATCVDGVTPNCAAPDAGCGPTNLDGGADADGSTTLPEGSTDSGNADAPEGDAPFDASDDVEDAGDEI